MRVYLVNNIEDYYEDTLQGAYTDESKAVAKRDELNKSYADLVRSHGRKPDLNWPHAISEIEVTE